MELLYNTTIRELDGLALMTVLQSLHLTSWLTERFMAQPCLHGTVVLITPSVTKLLILEFSSSFKAETISIMEPRLACAINASGTITQMPLTDGLRKIRTANSRAWY